MITPGIYRTLVFLLTTLIFVSCATSPPVDKGATYYDQSLYDQAAEEWLVLAEQGNFVAQHNLGFLSALGLGSTEQSLEDAATWFQKSAEQNYVPAMISLAEVQTALGDEPLAESWLKLAARWGNTEAIEYLRQKELPVPEPDLFSDQQKKSDRYRAMPAFLNHGPVGRDSARISVEDK